MNWFEQHLNLTYILGLAIGLVPLILIGFIHNSAVGYIIWMAVLLLASWWILGQKGRSYLYLALALLAAVIAIPVILCLSNEKSGAGRVTREGSDNYQKGSHVFKLSNIYKATDTDKPINTDHDFQYFQEVLSCPNCAFADQEARQQGKPWCNAPNPPDIKNNYCHTWQPESIL